MTVKTQKTAKNWGARGGLRCTLLYLAPDTRRLWSPKISLIFNFEITYFGKIFIAKFNVFVVIKCFKNKHGMNYA